MAYAFAGLIATVMQASGDDSSSQVTFGWHNRGANHWRGYIEAACAGTNNLQNPLEDRTELAPLMKYPGTSVSSGDLIEEWVCTNAAVCRVEVLELRDTRGSIALHLLNAAGSEVGLLTAVGRPMTRRLAQESSVESKGSPIPRRILLATREGMRC